MSSNVIHWDDVIKKEARGIEDEDFGEIQGIQGNYVIIQRGLIDKEKYYIPKNQVKSYDGHIVNFRISESDLKTRYKDEPFMNDVESDTIESDMNEMEEALDSLEVKEN
ncbi:MAG: hypothetical protein ACM3VV_06290 [Deltaproteobacteria bacterium]|nr:hypothetical protein [Nitrososphaeraceae archaeon]